MSPIIRNVASNPLEGNAIRVFGKEKISRTKEKGQEYRRIE